MRICLWQRRLFVILVSTVIIVLFWFQVDFLNRNQEKATGLARHVVTAINCLINEEYKINCLRGEGDEVYVPFSFLHKYFEVYGSLKTVTFDGKREEVLDWQHAYSKVIYPQDVYSPTSSYLWFQNFNVEERERVKLISAIHNVPVSSQWDHAGHIYPVQVAQFALSHFSKWFANRSSYESNGQRTLLEDGSFLQRNWRLGRISATRVRKSIDAGEPVLRVDGRAVFFVNENMSKKLHLIMSVKPLVPENFSLTVMMQAADGNKNFKVNFLATNEATVIRNNTIFYGIGSKSGWKHLVRSLATDLSKARIIASIKSKTRPQLLRITRIIVNGPALIDNVTLASNADWEFFQSAADYLLHSQDEKGGWPVSVTRRLSNGELVLFPGWYSAMAQGQAISVLTRMHSVTKDAKYLEAAIQALNVFLTNSSSGGVRAHFADRFVWFEEYPTRPSIFVLNGFIYSLFGLYDLKTACGSECSAAGHAFEAGIESLMSLLPLFDTGSGSLYDLRHFSLKSAPNIARWDYHTTHINQLLHLNTVMQNMQLQTTSKRWISYMRGKRAPHN